MKKIASTLSLLLAVMLILSSCGEMGGGSGSDSPNDGLIHITIAKQLDENSGRYENGDDINNNPMTRLTEEKLGIKMDTTLLGGDAGNYDTKLRLALTGSEDLPDVFPVYGTQMIADIIESGRAKDITEDIENYMPERLKAIYDQYPETFYPLKVDGKTYGLACCPALTEGQIMIIRQDWLDNLGLQAPTTIDEFEAVIQAFTENDPDGNGKKDTYGFFYAGDGVYNTGWVGDSVNVFSVYSGKNIPGMWYEDSSGDLMYGSIHEGNKKALECMAQWYAKGWTSPEAATSGAWTAVTEFTEGKAGIIIGRPWVINSVADVKSTDPKARAVGYPNILQENGQPTYQTAQVNDGWLMFNKDFDNMKAFFKYYDWLYDGAFGTGDFPYGYLQDYDFDVLEDGTVIYDSTLFDPPVANPFMPGKSTVLKNTPTLDSMQAYANAKAGKDPQNGQEVRAVADFESVPDTADGYALANEHRDELISNLFNTKPTETMTKVWDQLLTLEKQTYTNIIYGKQSIDTFDDFVAEWKAGGGDQITQEVNEWYHSVR